MMFFFIGYYHTMPNVWCIINGVLHTTNNGYDKNEKPIIPFLEFLQDIAQIGSKDKFIQITDDFIKNDVELKLLPKHMYIMVLKDISLFRKNYDEWKDYSCQFVVREI